MQPQLAAIETEFRKAEDRLEILSRSVPQGVWTKRLSPERWSVADCVEHLNRTAEEFLPVLRQALAAEAGQPRNPQTRYRRDPLGWALSVVMPPPVRFMRVKTSAPFQPTAQLTPPELIARFIELQEQQIACLRDADGLPLERIWVRSPFDARAKYNAYSCFVILPRHQHRHLWQAEQVVHALAMQGTA